MQHSAKTNLTSRYPSYRFSVAPMLDWTDKHCRYFYRLMSKNALLYTEMITTGAIIHGKNDYLAYNEAEHPVALQLGGSDPQALAHCAKLAQERGYDEINLNVGCPSDRVQNGRFGACLMYEPKVVAECIQAMKAQVDIPVTVKCRIGVDDSDEQAFLDEFIQVVSEQGGCDHFIIHARKAWLKGLSPKENRDIPPLNYDRVKALKIQFPHLTLVLNGGLTDLQLANDQLQHLDGVMLGREIYKNPYLLTEVDQLFFEGENTPPSREAVVEQMYPYIEQHLAQGGHLKHITRHMLGLFHDQPSGRLWRRTLSEQAHLPGAGIAVLHSALKQVSRG